MRLLLRSRKRSRRKLVKQVLSFATSLLVAGCVFPSSPASTIENHHTAIELIDKGTVFLRQGNLDAADASFNVAYELGLRARALDGLGCSAFLRGSFKRAEGLFLSAREEDPTYPNVIGNLALLYEALGRNAEAETLYKDAIQADPKNYKARNNYAGFLQTYSEASDDGDTVKKEFLKARVLVNDPLIDANIATLER